MGAFHHISPRIETVMRHEVHIPPIPPPPPNPPRSNPPSAWVHCLWVRFLHAACPPWA